MKNALSAKETAATRAALIGGVVLAHAVQTG